MSERIGGANGTGAQIQRTLRRLALCLYITMLAWAPFPLGGAIAWAAGLQAMLVAGSTVLWLFGSYGVADYNSPGNRSIILPAMLATAALLWAVVQTLPVVPQTWSHPVWEMAAEVLEKPVRGTISLNPWRTQAEIMKLGSYVMAAWLVFRMARHVNTADIILNAVIIITSTYAFYAFALELSGFQQTDIFYSLPFHDELISGPFMLHNSFATFVGLGAVASVVKLFAFGSREVVVDRGMRQHIVSILQFCFGRGAPLLVATVLTLGGVVACGSRAGFAATMCGLFIIALASIPLSRGRRTFWGGIGALTAAMPLLVILIFNGDTLAARFDQLLASDTGDVIRYSLWNAAHRMIANAPLLGLGLGAFEDAYPMYAVDIFPQIMDKAHCDYLEFAAGIGLPAAIAWWIALLWMSGLCLRAVFVRHRYRLYSVTALGATVLIAVHSSVDFSLQLPAVSLLYATLLGIGIAQSQATRHQRAERRETEVKEPKYATWH